MAYLTSSDFRLATLNEACIGLDLTDAEASDSLLTSVIASQSARIDALTNDHFEPETRTFEIDLDSTTSRIYLPRRARSISSVSTRDYTGTLTAEDPTAYRLHTSLNAGGDTRLDYGTDWIDVIPGQSLTTGLYWPVGPQVVQVTGTFGWSSTPFDIKRAVARLVYDRIKQRRPDLDQAESLSSAGVTVRFLETDADHPTGIREVDDIIADFRYAGGSDPKVLIA